MGAARSSPSRCALIAALAAFLCALPVRGVDRSWNASAGGYFGTAGNWLGGVIPTSLDNAVFNLAVPEYAVILNGSFTNKRLIVRDGQVDFAALVGATRTYTLTSTSNLSPSIVVGDVADLAPEFILDSGTLISTYSMIGQTLNSSGIAIVSGSSAIWSNSLSFMVGDLGSGALFISNSGRVNGSSLNLTVGNQNTGIVSIDTGGILSSNIVHIGALAGGNGTVLIDGPTSSMTCSGRLYVGEHGSGDLELVNGALVRSAGLTIANYDYGAVSLDSASRLESSSSVIVGNALGSFGQLTVQGGATLTSPSAVLANGAGSADVAVDGIGSKWTLTDNIDVGLAGLATLAVKNSGQLSAPSLRIGVLSTADGTVNLSDAGEIVARGATVLVGKAGSGTLNIALAAQLSNGSSTIAEAANSVGTATVYDPSSRWTMTSSLIVGAGGSGNLVITDAGQVTNTSAIIGQLAGGNGSVIVKDESSAWTSSGDLQVGLSGFGSLEIYTGGAVSCQNATIGGDLVSALATGIVHVNGIEGAFNVASQLTVGGRGAGVLSLEAAGFASAATVLVGAAQNGSGSIDLADDNTSLDAGSIFIGGDMAGPKGTGQVTVVNSASLSASTAITIWSGGSLIVDHASVSTPLIQLSGGIFSASGPLASNIRVSSGQIDIEADTLTLNGTLAINPNSILVKTGSGLLSIHAQSHASGSAFRIDGGAVEFNTDAGTASQRVLSLAVNSRSVAVFQTTQHLAGLHINDAVATIASGDTKLLRTDSLTLDSTALLDLNDADVIVHASASTRDAVLANLNLLLGKGRTTNPSTRWEGASGIISSEAAKSQNIDKGPAAILNHNDSSPDAPLFKLFHGEEVDQDDILIMYTWNGDSDLNGKINADDYYRLDKGYFAYTHGLLAAVTYQSGDFNYDGKIDLADYALIDSAFFAQRTVSPIPPRVVVPEPGCLSLVVVVFAIIARRRWPRHATACVPAP